MTERGPSASKFKQGLGALNAMLLPATLRSANGDASTKAPQPLMLLPHVKNGKIVDGQLVGDAEDSEDEDRLCLPGGEDGIKTMEKLKDCLRKNDQWEPIPLARPVVAPRVVDRPPTLVSRPSKTPAIFKDPNQKVATEANESKPPARMSKFMAARMGLDTDGNE